MMSIYRKGLVIWLIHEEDLQCEFPGPSSVQIMDFFLLHIPTFLVGISSFYLM